MYIAIHKYLTWIVTCTRTYKINNHTNPYRDQSDKFMYIAKHKYILDIYMYTHQQNLIHTKLIETSLSPIISKRRKLNPQPLDPTSLFFSLVEGGLKNSFTYPTRSNTPYERKVKKATKREQSSSFLWKIFFAGGRLSPEAEVVSFVGMDAMEPFWKEEAWALVHKRDCKKGRR